MTELVQAASQTHKHQEALRVAAELFRQGPDWVTFFREVMGVDGAIHRLFSSKEELEEFQQSGQYADIRHMVAELRGQAGGGNTSAQEATRVITVRLPASLHESLKTEAHDRNTSMNKLCITKLIQAIDAKLIPTNGKPEKASPQPESTQTAPTAEFDQEVGFGEGAEFGQQFA